MKVAVETDEAQPRPRARLGLRQSGQLWRVRRAAPDGPYEPQPNTHAAAQHDAARPWVLPVTCANCAANAGETARCETPFRSLLVPYCARCLRSLERERTQLSVSIAAALLLGLTLLLVLPWVGVNLSLPVYVGVGVLGVVLPLSWVALVGGGTAEEQTSTGSAVWWQDGALVGSNEGWMKQLAEQNAATLTCVEGRRSILSWPVAALPISVAAIGPAAYATFFPTLVILNLSAHDIELSVDGRALERVPLSSLESADAGTRLSLAAGTHLLEARAIADATVLERAQVALDAGELYLFAPASVGYCFWLEIDTYGKASTSKQIRRLGGNSGFFRLPGRVDSWFAANPEPGADVRSSGGDMVALRHARCPDAPSSATASD